MQEREQNQHAPSLNTPSSKAHGQPLAQGSLGQEQSSLSVPGTRVHRTQSSLQTLKTHTLTRYSSIPLFLLSSIYSSLLQTFFFSYRTEPPKERASYGFPNRTESDSSVLFLYDLHTKMGRFCMGAPLGKGALKGRQRSRCD